MILFYLGTCPVVTGPIEAPLEITQASNYIHCLRITNSSPLPNISTLAILISPRKSPQNAENGVPKMNFPELPGPRVSVEILQKPEFPGISRPIPISDFGVPISAFWGEMKLICWAALTNSGESKRPLTQILLKNIAIHLPFLSRYFNLGKLCPPLDRK